MELTIISEPQEGDVLRTIVLLVPAGVTANVKIANILIVNYTHTEQGKANKMLRHGIRQYAIIT